ncbi:MAG TPA: TPM domain-containing protein [Gemmatimonadaceae bacterium]|nr:TPM domain-containing protein [Gemmatimonadaceae bacterium]
MMRPRLVLPLALSLAAAAAAPAVAQESSTSGGSRDLRWVSRPNPTAGTWVSDPASHLASDTRYRLNQEISALRRATGTEIAVVVVDSTAGMRSSELAVALRDEWGIGGAGGENGILMLVVPPRRDLRLIVGRTLQPVLTAERLGRIEDEAILAEFRRRDLNAGVLRGVRELISAAREVAAARATTAARRPAASAPAPAPGLATLAGSSSTGIGATPVSSPARQSGPQKGVTPAVTSADSARRAATVASAFGADPRTVQRLSPPPKTAPAPARPAPPMSTRTGAASGAPGSATQVGAAAPPTPVLRNAPAAPAASTPARMADSAASRAIAMIGTLVSTPTRAAVVASTLIALGAAIGALGFRGLTNRRGICPSCARRALRSDSRIAREAAPGSAGAELVTERCGHCRWSRQYEQTIPALPAPPARRLSGPMLPPAQTGPRVSSGTRGGAGDY